MGGSRLQANRLTAPWLSLASTLEFRTFSVKSLGGVRTHGFEATGDGSPRASDKRGVDRDDARDECG